VETVRSGDKNFLAQHGDVKNENGDLVFKLFEKNFLKKLKKLKESGFMLTESQGEFLLFIGKNEDTEQELKNSVYLKLYFEKGYQVIVRHCEAPGKQSAIFLVLRLLRSSQ
jgi:hypothetical protein